jgi:hypothetical protein
MKLFAARVEIDADDVTLLYRQLGFTTVNEGLDLVGHAHTGRPIPAKVRFLLTEIVDSTHGLAHDSVRLAQCRYVTWSPRTTCAPETSCSPSPAGLQESTEDGNVTAESRQERSVVPSSRCCD